MPLFRNTWDNQSSREPETLPPSPSPPRKSSGFFGSRRSADDSPTRLTYTNTNTNTNTHANGYSRHSPTNNTSSGGFFSRRRSLDDDSSSDRSSGRSGNQAPSIVAARQKVADAENAERNADDALKRARNAVREAKDHIRILENEALEE
jgi:hypothetical protein